METLQFTCDAMLGGLARWLRFAGFDTRFEPSLPDAALAGVARREGRWLLTRDRGLAAGAGPRVLLLTTDGVDSQVAELRSRLGLVADPGRFFSRCSRCNAELEPVPAGLARDHVPPFVAARAATFARCPACGRFYWPGSHAGRIAEKLRKLFG